MILDAGLKVLNQAEIVINPEELLLESTFPNFDVNEAASS